MGRGVGGDVGQIDAWIALADESGMEDPTINVSVGWADRLGIAHLAEVPGIVGSDGYVDIRIARLKEWRESSDDYAP